MARQARSEERRRRALRARRSRTIAPLLMDLPRTALGTTERIPASGERFLAEHPEANYPLPSPYNVGAWLDPARSITRGTLAVAGSPGWPRRGVIVLLLVMLVGAIGGVAQMVGAVGLWGGSGIQNFLFGLLFCGLFGLQAFAFARRLLRPSAVR